MGRIISIVVFTLLGLLGGFQAGKWYENSKSSNADTAADESLIQSVLAEGKIRPAGGIRQVVTLPGRRISKLNVAVGNKTVQGKTELCHFDDASLLQMQWELAKSKKGDLATEIDQKILAAELNKSTAEAAYQKALLNKSRLSSESPESSYVDKKIESSQKKLERLKTLSMNVDTSAFVSTQDIFDQELELEKARSEKISLQKAADLAVESAGRALELAKKSLDNAKSLSKESKSLELAESIAKTQFENSRLFSPIDGEVIKIHAFDGDAVTNFPIMEIADLSELIVEAEVYFANLPEVKKGQRVVINSPALDKEITGVVESKSSYIGNGLLQSQNPLAMTDQETAKVRIKLDSEFIDIAKTFLNLQVTVEIKTN